MSAGRDRTKSVAITEEEYTRLLANMSSPLVVPDKPAPAPDVYKSKLERRFAQQLAAELLAGTIQGWLYEPFSFQLGSGKRYRPDFVTWGSAGIVAVECKGYHKNMRDSLTHLAWAAQRFPFLKWYRVTWESHAFTWEQYGG